MAILVIASILTLSIIARHTDFYSFFGKKYLLTEKVTESNFIDVFRQHFRNGDYPKMLEMTWPISIEKFGEKDVIECYKNIAFPAQMKYLSSEPTEDWVSKKGRERGVNSEIIYLRHEVDFMGLSYVIKPPVIRTGNKLLLILDEGVENNHSKCQLNWMSTTNSTLEPFNISPMAVMPKSSAPAFEPLAHATLPPQLKSSPIHYPRIAQIRGLEGIVKLDVLVLANGSVGNVKMAHSSGSEVLDDSAIEQVKTWRFTPAHQGDQSVDGWIRVPLNFNMDR